VLLVTCRFRDVFFPACSSPHVGSGVLTLVLLLCSVSECYVCHAAWCEQKVVLTPAQFSMLGDLVKFWKAAEQFSLLGSAYRSRELVLSIYGGYFREADSGSVVGSAPEFGYVPFSSVRLALAEVDGDALDSLDSQVADIVSNDAPVPSFLFYDVQTAVMSLLERGLLYHYLAWRWCSKHGALATQCYMLGRTCTKAVLAGPQQGSLGPFGAGKPAEPEHEKNILLFHVRQRYVGSHAVI
jgi:hypothetical protein